VLWSYLVLVVVLAAAVFAGEAGSLAGRHIQVDLTGGYSGPGSPTGVLGTLAAVTGAGFILAPLFWPAFVARQVLSGRRASGERRQQLKWLMGGAIIALVGLALVIFGPPKTKRPAGSPGTWPSWPLPRCRSAWAWAS
jgi:hypothetical protein